jgi:hypothetical protein
VIVRVIAIGLALLVLPVLSVQADQPAMKENIVVPPPPPPPPAAMEPVVVKEEVVTAPPPPFVELERKSIAAGIGISWGGGTLTFEGRPYAFSVKGLSLGDLGASRTSALGDVRNLESLADFAGHYVAVGAGAAAGPGAGAIAMRNEKGVVITLRSDIEGVQLSLGPEGLTIALE